jgi:hypothetical protein
VIELGSGMSASGAWGEDGACAAPGTAAIMTASVPASKTTVEDARPGMFLFIPSLSYTGHLAPGSFVRCTATQKRMSQKDSLHERPRSGASSVAGEIE